MANRPASGDLNPIFDTDFSRRIGWYQSPIFYMVPGELFQKSSELQFFVRFATSLRYHMVPYGIPGYGSLGILGPDGIPRYGSLGILGPYGIPGGSLWGPRVWISGDPGSRWGPRVNITEGCGGGDGNLRVWL